MRPFLISLTMLLAACSDRDGITVVAPPPVIPADLLQGCTGHTGPVPRTERQLILAAAAEKRGRLCANGRIDTIREIVTAD